LSATGGALCRAWPWRVEGPATGRQEADLRQGQNKRILALLDKPPPPGYARWTGPLLAKALGDVDVQYVWRFLREHKIDLADGDARGFAKRCEGDRHHFRFIVSPHDTLEMTDLRGFTCDLMREIKRDLGTILDWTVDRWTPNTHTRPRLILRETARPSGVPIVIAAMVSRATRRFWSAW
jgi:hypothetical protein